MGTEIKKVDYSHEAMINWLIANPHKQLKEMALEFSVTQGWISTVIHSDAFQAKLIKRQDAFFGNLTESVQERMVGTATMALDRLQDLIPCALDVKDVGDVTDKLLHRLGYAPASTRNGYLGDVQGDVHIQNNFVTKEELDKARDSIKEKHAGGDTIEALPAPAA